MEGSRLGALLVLIGGVTYVASGALMLGSAIAGYLVLQIPISQSQSILLTPIPLYSIALAIGASLVELVSGLIIVRSAKAFVVGNLTGARRRASRASVAAFVGATASLVVTDFALQGGTVLFFSYGYGNLGSASLFGLIVTISGAWFSYWMLGKTSE